MQKYVLSDLDSGQRVITERIPSVRSVALGFWIGAGARDETPSKAGITHFIEHLLFKGTTSRSALDIAKAMDAVGGEFKLTTSQLGPNFFIGNNASADGTYASLARTKFDQINKTYSGTLGGPIVRNRAFFFVAYEDARATSPQTQLNARPGVTPENFQQTTVSPFFNCPEPVLNCVAPFGVNVSP